MRIENVSDMNQLSRKKAYCLYLRKSRADLELEARGEFETLARHEAQLMEMANRMGLHIAKIYREIVSGESIQDRPQMQQMLQDIYEGKYEGVLVMEVERLARGNTADQGRVAEAFKISSTKIITPMKTYDPNDEYDEEYFEFSLFMSRREFKTITRRMVQGKMQALAEGNYMAATPPFGYDAVKRGRNNRTLKPNEFAVYVEHIFKWFTEDRLSTRAIAKKLTDMGIHSPSDKMEWHYNTVKGILLNPIYIGKMKWGERKTIKKYIDGKIVKYSKRTADGGTLIEGKHPAIISEDLFYKAQEVLKIRATPIKSDKQLTNALAGVVRCKRCGCAMRRQQTKKAQPRIVHPESLGCKMKSIYYDYIYDAIIRGLWDHIDDFQFKMTNESMIEESARIEFEIKEMEKEIKTLEEQKQTQFDMFERKIYSEDEFIQRRASTNERIELLKSKIEEMKSQVKVDVNYEEKIITFKDVIKALRDDSVSVKHKNELLKDIIERVDYENTSEGVTLDIILK